MKRSETNSFELEDTSLRNHEKSEQIIKVTSNRVITENTHHQADF